MRTDIPEGTTISVSEEGQEKEGRAALKTWTHARQLWRGKGRFVRPIGKKTRVFSLTNGVRVVEKR